MAPETMGLVQKAMDDAQNTDRPFRLWRFNPDGSGPWPMPQTWTVSDPVPETLPRDGFSLFPECDSSPDPLMGVFFLAACSSWKVNLLMGPVAEAVAHLEQQAPQDRQKEAKRVSPYTGHTLMTVVSHLMGGRWVPPDGKNRPSLLSRLTSLGFDPNMPDAEGRLPGMHALARQGSMVDFSVLTFALSQGVNPFAADEHGRTVFSIDFGFERGGDGNPFLCKALYRVADRLLSQFPLTEWNRVLDQLTPHAAHAEWVAQQRRTALRHTTANVFQLAPPRSRF